MKVARQPSPKGRAALVKAEETRVAEWSPVKLDATPVALAAAPAPTPNLGPHQVIQCD